ncbi:MaoC/PaaZ C-terminal domain-containing protein [Cryptosporangium aurantiacum]|uniref:MaoC like domain-containing protein n=1 Tax=Cryptosporangium aurantiacum TaxID=134849 RepID=A0A1M7QAH1_9ACTN|nr:MaoC/PaaZ C-terminal domain-containing protein [Cryptosporangium aurantiacum]SHN27599.1 MaoC like domain-containing protein [Cryptosporangium aurantiacum]
MTIVLDGSALRGWRGSHRGVAERSGLARYAAATADQRPDRLAGDVASPVWTCVPFGAVARDFFTEFLGDRVTGRLVHLGHSIVLHAPVRAGSHVLVDAGVVALRHTPQGATVELQGTASSPDGQRLAEQSGTFLVAGSSAENPFTEPQPGAELPDPAVGPERALTVTVDRDQAVRYADATGDRNPIHLDAAAARRIGFAAPILHGLCTLALTCHALEHEVPGAEVGRLTTEFARPVFPGDVLTVRWYPTGVGAGFEVLNRRRRPVLRAGCLRSG